MQFLHTSIKAMVFLYLVVTCHIFLGPPKQTSMHTMCGAGDKDEGMSRTKGGGGWREAGSRKEKTQPWMESLLISNGNIWKCTLPLAKHTLDRGQATSEKRQKWWENVTVWECVWDREQAVSVDYIQPEFLCACAVLYLNRTNLFLCVCLEGWGSLY